MRQNRRQFFILWLLGGGIWLVFHLYAFSGMKGYDGIEYARHATELLEGGLDLEDHHFAYRWGVVMPAAFFYRVFGVNDLSSALPAMIASLLMLGIILWICREFDWVCKLVVLLLFCLSPNVLYYWDKLMPDIQVALGALLALWSRYEFEKGGNSNWGFLLALGLFWALLAKATVVLLVPVLLFLFVLDLVQKKAWWFWGRAAALGGLLLLAYFLSIYIFTGDPFSRFDRIAAKGYLNTCSYDQLEWKYLLKRVAYELVYTWGQNGTLIAFLPLLASFIFIRKKIDAARRYWVDVGMLSFLASNFMSISPTAYVPMCADERHFLFVLAPWALGSGLTLVSVLRNQRASFFLFFLSILLLIWTNGYVKWHYGLLALASLMAVIPYFKETVHRISLILLLLSLFMVPFNYAIYLRGLFYKEHRNALYTWQEKQQGSTVVVTNAVQERLGNYYNGFDSAFHIQFREFDEVEEEWVEKKPQAFLLINAYARFMSGMDWSDLPVYAREIPDILDPIYKAGHSEMYALPDISWVQFPEPFWEDSLVHGIPSSEGEELPKAEVVKPKSFASGWERPFSTFAQTEGRYWIRANIQVRNMDQGEANWQIHVDDSLGNNQQWKSASLKHRTPVPGKWVRLQIDHLVDIPNDSSQRLKMRFWNDGPANFEIASLKVQIAWLPKK